MILITLTQFRIRKMSAQSVRTTLPFLGLGDIHLYRITFKHDNSLHLCTCRIPTFH